MKSVLVENGIIIAVDEKAKPEAIKAVTINAVYQYLEEDKK